MESFGTNTIAESFIDRFGTSKEGTNIDAKTNVMDVMDDPVSKIIGHWVRVILVLVMFGDCLFSSMRRFWTTKEVQMRPTMNDNIQTLIRCHAINSTPEERPGAESGGANSITERPSELGTVPHAVLTCRQL